MSSAPPPPVRHTKDKAKANSKALRHRIHRDEHDSRIASYPPITSALSLLNEEPDMTIGEQVKLKGNLTFDSLLRIDGTVEGELIAPNDAGIIIGPNGVYKGNLKNFSTILVEGKIIGNINDVESITLKESAVVFGNISCKSIETLPNSTIIGYLNIDPFLIINKNDSNNNNNKHHLNEPQGGNHDDGTVSPENSDISKDQKLPSPRLIPMNESSNMPSVISGDQQVNTNKVKNEIPQKVIVLIVDPQIDFHFGGSMAINGANEDSERIAEFIKDNIPKIDEVFVTLDSHHRMHIAHGIFWKNESNESPTADTIITLGDFDRGKWHPRDSALAEHCRFYLDSLEKNKNEYKKQLMIKPEHCLIGSKGHSVVPLLNDAIQQWAGIRLRKIGYVMKGTCCLVDMQSAIVADIELESDPSTHYDENLLKRLHTADKLILCGLTQSKVLGITVKDIIDHWTKDKSLITVINNNIHSSNNSDKDVHDQLWNYINSTGVKCLRAEEVFLE